MGDVTDQPVFTSVPKGAKPPGTMKLRQSRQYLH